MIYRAAEMVEIKMDAEIGSYQADEREPDEPLASSDDEAEELEGA